MPTSIFSVYTVKQYSRVIRSFTVSIRKYINFCTKDLWPTFSIPVRWEHPGIRVFWNFQAFQQLLLREIRSSLTGCFLYGFLCSNEKMAVKYLGTQLSCQPRFKIRVVSNSYYKISINKTRLIYLVLGVYSTVHAFNYLRGGSAGAFQSWSTGSRGNLQKPSGFGQPSAERSGRPLPSGFSRFPTDPVDSWLECAYLHI